MAASQNSSGDAVVDEEDAYVYVYDRRERDSPETKIPTGGLFTFADFRERVKEAFKIGKNEKFIISTTNREEIKDDSTWDIIDKGETLYLLNDINQELCAPAQEKVDYLPHYDTIVKGGMYEYYASEGQNPLSYAFAELIDNALAATANNDGYRHIDIRLHFDESSIYVIDNGKGMTPRQLNNWAIYRLSKFIRKDKRSKVNLDETVEEEQSFIDHSLPKSLNSDISYFGVGGKQAVFFIGNSCRMITRSKETKDVHELSISKDEFEQKEKNHESIYSGFIRNRKAGDASHIPEEEEVLRNLITQEESKWGSFTVVLIQGISKEHLQYLRERMKEWTRQLAHIYHYYLHGPFGNVVDDDGAGRTPSPFRHIELEVKMWLSKSQSVPRQLSLRDIDNDMQTMYVRGAVDTFEFRAHVEGAVIEGALRYHPFLYDRETYPVDVFEKMEATIEDEHDYAITDTPARGRRAIFECYWNGRLIPYTMIDGFDWCLAPKKAKSVPVECYNRVSGVLWTDDSFQVSTNKLTFLDLELKLRDKLTVFSRVVNGQEKRTAIEREYTLWLKECHELYDKQIHFSKFDGQVVRSDLPKQKQTPWAAYKQVEWDGRIFKQGQLVKIARTVPTLVGSIKRILLFGDHSGDVYATGGDLEIIQEPTSIYNETKIVPLTKLDRTAGVGLIRKYIEEEEGKLPCVLEITWPEGNHVIMNEKRQAGKPIGDIRAEILNKKGDKISKLPGRDSSKKLLVELKVILHASNGDQTIVSHISQHGKNWPYWFRKMENVKNLGSYTLQLQVVLNESGENQFSGKTLPCMKIPFSIIEAEAEKFSVGLLEGPFRVGVPFQIPLDLQDSFGNPAKAKGLTLKPVLDANGVDLSYSGSGYHGHTFTIKEVMAKAQIQTVSGKNFTLTIKVPELNDYQQTLKIRLLPGPATTMEVTPDTEQVIENGQSPSFHVQVKDLAGNPTVLEPRQFVVCKFHGMSGSLPSYTVECTSPGGCTVTGDPIVVKKIKSELSLDAKIDIQGSKTIKTVERKVKVTPSGKTCDIKLFYQPQNGGKPVEIKPGQELKKAAGEMLEGITFHLYDEAERQIKIDDKIASKIKVNWASKVPKDLALKGQLPSVKATTTVSEPKYCQVSIADNSGILFDFVLMAEVGEPASLKCSCSGQNVISIGQPLDSEIHVKVKDKFGNDIVYDSDKVVKHLNIIGEGLKKDLIKMTLFKDTNTMIIKGIVFEGGTIGRKELQVTWHNLKDYVRLDMVAGPPAQIALVGIEPNEEIVVYSENKMTRPIVVQLLDAGGNVCRKPDVRIQLQKEAKFKIIPTPTPAKTNKDGIADFGTFTMACAAGTYELQPNAYIATGFVVPGPKFKITVKADPTKPSKLDVSYNNKHSYVAGGPMPEYKVSMFAEDSTPLASSKPSHLSLKMWPSEGPDRNSLPSRTLSYNPESGKKSDVGVFYFKNIKVPEEVGAYNIMFVYYDGKHQLFSNVIHVKIEPSVPVTFEPVDDPGTAAVSNTRQYTARCIVRNLKIELRDKFNNHVVKGMNGGVQVTVQSPSGEKNLPQLVGADKSKCLNLTLAGGTCIINQITITENSPGKDGSEYQLKCTVQCNNIPKDVTVQPYIIPFLFYDDAKKQSEMATLSKERDSLQNAIKTYRSLFDTTEQLIEELKLSVKEAQAAETKIRQELRRQAVNIRDTNSVESIDKLIKSHEEMKEDAMNRKRRLCCLQTIMPNDPEVLGKIGHLAHIGDDDAARVLSWHMSSDMDCVVTMTTKKAKEIYSQTSGRQQVLPLDSIFRKSLTDWDKPLPHIKYKPNWRPPGKLMYARKLLSFPNNRDKCQTVFSMLLGDTLWIDTLDQANDYRRELVKYTNCPTILTREGDRIRSNGKFGGLMNKAPPIEKLRGAIFGAPVPEEYHKMCSVLETLRNLKSAMVVHRTAQEELQDQTDTIQAPEMQAKYDECKDVEKQLRDIEKKLGVVSTPRTMKPPKDLKRTPDHREDGPSLKKFKTSPAVSEMNGSSPAGSVNSTPTRQSRRIAAKTPESEPKKKFKKS